MATPYPPSVPPGSVPPGSVPPGSVPRGLPIPRTSGLAIAGFVCSFFCGLVGLILSILGRNECKRSGGLVQGEGLALAGIIISSISLALGVLGIVAAVAIPAFMDYAKVAKKSEATIELQKIGLRAVAEYTVSSAFPIGKAEPTPGVSCCTQNALGRRKCAPDPAQFSAPVWRALDFQLHEPHYFQYTYESSDGRSFTATAIGDLDCDGNTVTYVLQGSVEHGTPKTTLVEPPRNAD